MACHQSYGFLTKQILKTQGLILKLQIIKVIDSFWESIFIKEETFEVRKLIRVVMNSASDSPPPKGQVTLKCVIMGKFSNELCLESVLNLPCICHARFNKAWASILFTRSSLASLPLDLDFFELEALTFAASRLVFKNISFQNLLNISNQKCCFTKYIHKVWLSTWKLKHSNLNLQFWVPSLWIN